MDTVRSEYSEGSITSSRLDDGSATDRGSLSFSYSSRLSIDSASTRSDYLSSYERKFHERKAAKHKKVEKAKRAKEKADRQDIMSADVKRKAQREAERQARRKEMENWLTDPKELRRLERRSQKLTRDRMKTLKEWYKPAISGPYNEVQPVFVAAQHQRNNQEQGKSLLTKEAAALKDAEDREALEAVLHHQLAAFTSKLEYLEQFADPAIVRAKTRAGPRRRRRIAAENLQLKPLGPRSNIRTVKSVSSLPVCSGRADTRLVTSASLLTLGYVNNDEADDAEVEEYLLQHRKISKQIYTAIKIQATWRMYRQRQKYLPWKQRRTRHRRAIFEIWVMTYKVGFRAQRSLLRKYFTAWRIDVAEALQLREMELQLFQQAATQSELPRMVLNLVFTTDWEDARAKRLAEKAAEAAKKKSIAPISKAAFLNAFLSAAFSDVEANSDKTRSRVHQLRAQHVAAREEVRKKVVQHVFRLWKKIHEGNKRVGLNAQLCLKRAVRMAFGTRQRWPAEILLSVFEIWARWASFSRCKRQGLPLPHFAQSNPHWDIWLHNYQERQVRCVKAAAKAPSARLRRFFLRLHAFAHRKIRARQTLALAIAHYSRTVKLQVLLEWRKAIADSAAEKKLVRGILLRMHRYACAKRKLRPLKEILRGRRRKWLAFHAMAGWKRVQLHACFKRELNVSRLENCPAWRSRVQRILDIWRDNRDSLILWRTFEGWAHFIRKRKLFLTLRMLCARQQRRNLLFAVFNAWKGAKWDRTDSFLEDSLRLDAWESYRELSVFFPMMFYGSFSDAGSIFGGLPSYMYGESNSLERLKKDKQDLLLATSGEAVRHFHGVLVRDSVMEVRNVILQSRHLVNTVDDSSGNTALHIAAQIEEPERRLEIVTLLLSEGAATLKRVNRHGLSPVQLAPDTDTRSLLNEGIYAFHSRKILSRESVEELDKTQRLLWCMTMIMTGEWTIGVRIPAELRTGQWHSTLQEELWLRQKQIRFAVDSNFSAAVNRSRGFLNALKTRLCFTHHDFLRSVLPRKQVKGSSKTRKVKENEAGDYEAYTRYLLGSTLDTEACEQELIPSFVGLLFSLEFSTDDVLAQAYKLEDECSTGESELWEIYQRIQQAEKEWSALFSKGSEGSSVSARNDVGMLRLFSTDASAELFFKQELFFLEFEQFCARDGAVNDLDSQQEALKLDIDSLLIRSKRKFRKADKKVKKIQDQIDEKEKTYRDALFIPARRVEDVCGTRLALEQSRLAMAMALMKQSEMKTVVAHLEYAKRVLETGESELEPTITGNTLNLPYHEHKMFLEKEMARYSSKFQARVILEEKLKTESLPEALHPLQKEAVSKLHRLLVLNLFRSCCCWLAENMVAMDEKNQEDNEESESEDSAEEEMLGDENLSKSERRSVKLARLQSAATLFTDQLPRRRSSLKNTRRVLETYHQGFSSRNLYDPDSETMNTTYAASSLLLFEEERRLAEEEERTRQNTTTLEVLPAISEHNPLTGELEMPPTHFVSLGKISSQAKLERNPVVEVKEIRRNRKREELERAKKHRRLQRQPGDSGSDSDEGFASVKDNLLPVLHGSDFHFGNFVVGSSAPDKDLSRTTVSNPKVLDSFAAEAMWRRGGVKSTDSSAPGIKEVLEKAQKLSSSREKMRAGSRRRIVVPDSPGAPQPLPEVPEVTSPQVKVPETQEEVKQQSSRSLNRASSVSSLQPASPTPTPTTPTIEEKVTPLTDLVDAIPMDNSSGSDSGGKVDGSVEVLSGEIDSKGGEEHDAGDESETTAKIDAIPVESMTNPVELETNSSELVRTEVVVDENKEELAVEVCIPILQSPVVEISSSRVSERVKEYPTTEEPSECESVENPIVRPDTPFVKWEDDKYLEAFPLAVTPMNQQKSIVRNASKGMPRSISVDVLSPVEEAAARFLFEEFTNDDKGAQPFTLQGKSLVIAKKKKRAVRSTKSIETPKLLPKRVQVTRRKEPDVIESSEPGSAPLVRPISVTVIAKPSKREEVSEAVEIVPTVSVLEMQKPAMPSPKPFMRLDRTPEADVERSDSTELQLEGTGLNTVVSKSVELVKVGEPKTVSPSKRIVRRKLRQPLSTGDLALQGARMVIPRSNLGEKPMELTGFEGMEPLSKAEKERLWREFGAEPLSPNVHDAYAILYPRTYQVPVATERLTVAQAPSIPEKSSSGPVSLRVDATRQPIQKEIELNRKFWSAIEGYRAIGSSALVPLDAATITQRRHDKAEAIFDQFLRGHRDKGSNRENYGLALPWLDMYPKEVAEVRKQLENAPKWLFDDLQRTAEWQISAALASDH
ncbi:hypothetical protein P3T76_009581 [Phytophthora citrophthora]|uniref:Uncharacterized protein n=1 Tax=Phytophthora citrophthora TaxID=4793 RepID=A0AAD9GG35_9STRA|nr:hypothetical protein P3T76_009581 [Phytophthora citrophthora]